MPATTINYNNRTRTALAESWGYKPFLADGITPNPQTEGQFVDQQVKAWVKLRAAEWQQYVAALAAKAAVVIDEVT